MSLETRTLSRQNRFYRGNVSISSPICRETESCCKPGITYVIRPSVVRAQRHGIRVAKCFKQYALNMCLKRLRQVD